MVQSHTHVYTCTCTCRLGILVSSSAYALYSLLLVYLYMYTYVHGIVCVWFVWVAFLSFLLLVCYTHVLHRMFGTVKNVLCSLSCPIIVPVAHCNVV